MQRIEVTVKASSAKPLALVFMSTDTADAIVDRVPTLTWIIGQVEGYSGTRGRVPRPERAAALNESLEQPAEA